MTTPTSGGIVISNGGGGNGGSGRRHIGQVVEWKEWKEWKELKKAATTPKGSSNAAVTHPHLVHLPSGLNLLFDVGKFWKAGIDITIGLRCATTGGLIEYWMHDGSLLGVAYGSKAPQRENIIFLRSFADPKDKFQGLSLVRIANKLYDRQIEALIKAKEAQGLSPTSAAVAAEAELRAELKVKYEAEDELEATGIVHHRLRWDTAMIIPLSPAKTTGTTHDGSGMDDIGREEEIAAVNAGEAKVIALNEEDAKRWFRANVVAIDRNTVESVVGPLPRNYQSLNAFQLAAHFNKGIRVKELEAEQFLQFALEWKRNQKVREQTGVLHGTPRHRCDSMSDSFEF